MKVSYNPVTMDLQTLINDNGFDRWLTALAAVLAAYIFFALLKSILRSTFRSKSDFSIMRRIEFIGLGIQNIVADHEALIRFRDFGF